MTSNNTIDAARVELLLSELRLPAIKLMWAALAARADKEGWPAARSSRRTDQTRQLKRTLRPDQDLRGLSEFDRVSRRRPGRLKSEQCAPCANDSPPLS